eukprot:6182474-Pleurochrysis_carterae.AAC.3
MRSRTLCAGHETGPPCSPIRCVRRGALCIHSANSVSSDFPKPRASCAPSSRLPLCAWMSQIRRCKFACHHSKPFIT